LSKIKLLNGVLDTLLFIVPLLELSEVATLIPPHWLPWYMLATVVLRRIVRLLEERLKRNVEPA
jgi:uncharacterized membrane protein (DUF106 family)